MTDLTLDSLLEAVRLQAELIRIVTLYLVAPGSQFDWLDIETRSRQSMDKLDALIAQRRGRPDDQPPGA